MAKSLVTLKVPIYAIDNMIFQKVLYILRPDQTIPNAQTLSRLINAYNDEIEVSLRQ